MYNLFPNILTFIKQDKIHSRRVAFADKRATAKSIYNVILLRHAILMCVCVYVCVGAYVPRLTEIINYPLLSRATCITRVATLRDRPPSLINVSESAVLICYYAYKSQFILFFAGAQFLIYNNNNNFKKIKIYNDE